MPPVIEAATAVATTAAAGTFKYNRSNYMFDGALRYSRYTAGYSMAMAQASMYREDIRDLTALTVTKQDTYHTVGVIFFVLNFQLIMAGRLGVHGPSPPGWLLGLYWTNICTALMFLVTFTWLAMHASARATAGGAYMLTRSVRLPIPTPKMLDKARTTGNTYEKQRLTDMFRIPLVTPAPRDEDPELGGRASSPPAGPEPAGSPRAGRGGQRRAPKWYRDEVKELHGKEEEGGCATSNPEHFELYRGLQEEWWSHDVYARIGVLFFMSHWLSSASLYSMCHVFGELRCLWPAWSVTACFVTAHYGILSLDIVNKPRETSISIPVEKVVPFVPVVAVLGMSLDYSVLTPTKGWQAVIYFLSYICYAIQLLWALRLYDLASPQVQVHGEMSEMPGQPWWPAEWPLPPAFQDAIYMVAAPKHLEPGQTCLQREMKAGRGHKDSEGSKGRQASPALFPWKLFRGACITSICMWVLIICGRVFEQVNGERQLLKQEGRVMRWPSHMQPWMPPWTRLGSRNEWCHAGGCDRRLSMVGGQQREVATMAQRLAAALEPLADALDTPAHSRPVELGLAPLHGAKVNWPTQFQPALLASANKSLVVLSRTGHGAMLPSPKSAASFDEPPKPFVLRGADELGDILGASWGATGLMITTASGALAECAGLPVEGDWPCVIVAAKLPMGGSSLSAGVAARLDGTSKLRAAVVFAGEGNVVLFETDADASSWLPAGEIHSPFADGQNSHLSMTPSAQELIISTADGTVLKRALVGEELAKKVAVPQPGSAAPGTLWHGACCLGGDRVAHLASPPVGIAPPQLFFSASH